MIVKWVFIKKWTLAAYRGKSPCELTYFDSVLVQLRAGGDVRVDDQQVELFFAFLGVERGEKHAAAVDAHHAARRQVGDGDESLADELFGLVEGVDAAEYCAVGAGAVVERELKQLLALFDSLAGLDLDGAEVALAEIFEGDVVREQRLDLYLAEVDHGCSFCILCGRGRGSFAS